MTSEKPKRLRVREVAALFDVGRDVIYRAIRTGQLPAERVGHAFRVTADDVEVYREYCRRAATNPEREKTSA